MEPKQRSTTKLSLNDRFKLIRQNVHQHVTRPVTLVNEANINNRRNAARQLRQGSAKNRRLAMQMGNRPSVIAALRGNEGILVGQQALPVRNRIGNAHVTGQSVKQRLGRVMRKGNVGGNNAGARRPLNRGALNIGTRLNVNAKGRLANRVGISRANQTGGRQTIGRIGARKQPNKQVGFVGGRKGVGQKRQFGQKGRQGVNVNQRQRQMQGNRGNKLRLNRNNFGGKNNPNQRQQFQQKGRRKLNQPRRRNATNRNNLDQDLETYMAKTRNHLDADLDAYMSNAN